MSSIVLCCFPVPGGSLLPCYVVLSSSAWSSPWSLPSPWLPLCSVFGATIVLHSCYMSGPSPLLFQCVFYNVSYLSSFPDLWAWYLILYLWISGLAVQNCQSGQVKHTWLPGRLYPSYLPLPRECSCSCFPSAQLCRKTRTCEQGWW